MNNEQMNSVNPNANVHYRQRKNAEEMKHQVITFALMIFLTLIAFVAVAYDGFQQLVYNTIYSFVSCYPSSLPTILFYAYES